MRNTRLGRGTSFGCCLGLMAVCGAQTKLDIDAAPIERVLTFSRPDEYTVEFKKGEFYAVTAFQEDVDLVLDVFDPDGKQLASVDSPNGNHGPEEWDAVAPATAAFKFVVRRFDENGPDGKYTMVVHSATGFAKTWIVENVESPRMAKLWQASMSDPHAVEAFLAERQGRGPLIEPGKQGGDMLTFFLLAPAGTRAVSLGAGPSPEGTSHMHEMGNSGLWFVTLPSPADARYIYSFDVHGQIRVGDNWVPSDTLLPDPTNPVRSGSNSMLILEDAPKQPFSAEPGRSTPRGTVSAFDIDSAILKEKRTCGVYTPAGFDPAKHGAYGIMFVFDGETYRSAPQTANIQTPKILDNAIAAGKVVPLIVVLVNNMGERNRDLPCYKPFADFMAKELLPAIRNRYPAASCKPSRVIVAGSSFGGLCSTYCALTHPEAFGDVLSQSGSYWVSSNDFGNDPFAFPREAYIPTQFKERKRLPIRFYIEVGTYENTSEQLRTNRHLRDVLQLKGYDVTYREFNGNHDYNVWRGSIVDGLVCLTRDWK